MKSSDAQKIRRILIIIGIIFVILSVLGVFAARGSFTRRNIRILTRQTQTYGPLSPFILLGLLFLNIAIPPLPLPVSILEMAGGYLYGFGPGVLIIWGAQVLAGLFDFWLARYIGKRIFRSILTHPYIKTYRTFLTAEGPKAIVIMRSLLASPWNVASVLPGLSDMTVGSFLWATAVGSVPEALLFAAIGTYLRHTRFNIWYVFLLILVVTAASPFITYLLLRRLRQTGKSK
jgi:uncharacterized membrane protein YdjX (TVP38/TMEM64 family)